MPASKLLLPALLLIALIGCGRQQETPQDKVADTAEPPAPVAPAMGQTAAASETPVAETPVAEAKPALSVKKAAVEPEPVAIPTPSAPQASAADVAAGKAKYGSFCAGCHGPKAEGIASYPRLAGQGTAVIATKLAAFRAGQKIGPQSASMIPISRMLTETEVQQVAAYLGSL